MCVLSLASLPFLPLLPLPRHDLALCFVTKCASLTSLVRVCSRSRPLLVNAGVCLCVCACARMRACAWLCVLAVPRLPTLLHLPLLAEMSPCVVFCGSCASLTSLGLISCRLLYLLVLVGVFPYVCVRG